MPHNDFLQPIDQQSELTTLQILQGVFESAQLGICITDSSYRYVKVNRAYCDLYGYTEAELLGKPFTLVVPPGDHERLEKLHDDFLSGRVDEIAQHWTVRHRSGRDIDIYATAGRLVTPGGLAYKITTAADVSELKTLQKQTEYQQAILIQQAKLAEVGAMVGAIAHQWQQPVNAIALMTQTLPLLLDQGTLTRENLNSHVEQVMQQIRFMSQTMNDFRDFYLPSREQEIFHVSDAIATVRDLLQGQLLKAKATLEISASEPLLYSRGYPSEFKQVVLNIINNALDIFQEQQRHDGHIAIKVEPDESMLTISIRDNGGGIPVELLPDRIFEPFFSTKPDKGTGIGLSLARTIIEEKSGGTIRAENGPEGACFLVRIPRHIR